MRTVFVLALVVATVFGNDIQYGFPSFQVSPFTGRIVGGTEAPAHAAPYIVSLQRPVLGHFCAGSIIGSKRVLTAAHCINNLGLLVFVVAGLHDIQYTSGSQTVGVYKSIQHPEYDGGVGPYDIGIIVTWTSFAYNEKVEPIALPEPDVIHSGLATLYGWGSTSNTTATSMPRFLMTVIVPIIKYIDCEDHLGGPGASPLHPTNICTGPLTGGISACSGDSGGPLIQNNTLIGVVSWGYIPCGSAPSIFTRVSAHIDFINAHM